MTTKDPKHKQNMRESEKCPNQTMTMTQHLDLSLRGHGSHASNEDTGHLVQALIL